MCAQIALCDTAITHTCQNMFATEVGTYTDDTLNVDSVPAAENRLSCRKYVHGQPTKFTTNLLLTMVPMLS